MIKFMASSLLSWKNKTANRTEHCTNPLYHCYKQNHDNKHTLQSYLSSVSSWTITYYDFVPKGVQMGGSNFWLSIKSISNTLSCCCFVCVFIIGQHHSETIWAPNLKQLEKYYFLKVKIATRFDPWKWTRSQWVLSMLSFTYINQNITSVTDLHTGDIALHSAYKIDYH